MDFRIADTFTDSLARLTGVEQKAVKTTAFEYTTPLTGARCPCTWTTVGATEATMSDI